jgi:hypothetical protein
MVFVDAKKKSNQLKWTHISQYNKQHIDLFLSCEAHYKIYPKKNNKRKRGAKNMFTLKLQR